MKTLDVFKTVTMATDRAIANPGQDLDNVLEITVGDATGLTTGFVKDFPLQVANYTEIKTAFFAPTNMALIQNERLKTIAKMEQDYLKANKSPQNIAIQRALHSGMVWSIPDKEKQYPYLSNKVEDCFNLDIPADGIYQAFYDDHGYFRGDLTTPKEVEIKGGRVNVNQLCNVFLGDYAQKDNHIFIEQLEMVEGRISIFCGS